MKSSGVIIDEFPVHFTEREYIYKSWLHYRWRLIKGMVFQGYRSQMQPLNFIKDYYGEKFGFYLTWLIHYTGWLIPVAFIGVICGIIIIAEGWIEGKELDHYLSSPFSILYGLVIMIWITLFHESWKRK